MNKVISIGRLTDEPKMAETSGGKKIARFTLALDRMKDGADFPNYVAWDKKAEVIENYCHKGQRIGIIGRIQTGSYEGKNGKVYTTDIVVEDIEFLEKKTDGQPTKNESDEFMKIPEGIENEIPFG